MSRGRTICEVCDQEVLRAKAYETWKGGRLFWVCCENCLRSPVQIQQLPDGLHIGVTGEPATIKTVASSLYAQPPSFERGGANR